MEIEQAALWDTLFLTVPELKEVLEYVRLNTPHEYLHAMLLFAAQTGARRSELLRSRLMDEVDPIIRTPGGRFLDGVSEVGGERFGRRARVSGWTGSGGGVRGSRTESTPATLDDNRLPTCTP